MMNDNELQAGDWVVCVDATPPAPLLRQHIMVLGRIKKGADYQIALVVRRNGNCGLHLVGIDHRPTDGWQAWRFQKLQKLENLGSQRACATTVRDTWHDLSEGKMQAGVLKEANRSAQMETRLVEAAHV